MRIQAACKQTRLTERAIRLYIKEGLLSPGQHNGILDFTEDDLTALRHIGALRQAGFSVPQIHQMLQSADCIPAVLRERMDQLRARADSDQDMLSRLLPLADQPPRDIPSLVAGVWSGPPPRSSLNLARLDEDVPDEKDIAAAWQGLDDLKRARRKRVILILLCVAALLTLLNSLRIAGSRMSPVADTGIWQMQRQLQTIIDVRDPDAAD